MGALSLRPTDNNYLTSRLSFQQMQQNVIELELDDDNCESSVTPQLILDGSGRAYLRGSLTLTGETPIAETSLFKLPKYLSISQDYNIPVVADTSGVLSFNAIRLLNASSGISSVTVDTVGSYATLPTVSTTGPGEGATFVFRMKALTAVPATAQSGAGSYAPGDTIVPAGGTSSTAATFTVTHTKVVSATIDNAGTGGTPGSANVTGTTGTGTKFQATVTISGGGVITSVNSISVAGDYTVNPTSLISEPVTGGGLTGAQLNIKMGVLTSPVTIAGSYTALPSSPVAQNTTSGSGTGATFTLTWGILSIAVSAAGEGYDDTSVLVISGGGGAGGGAASIVLGSQSSQVAGVLGKSGTQNDIISLDGTVFFVNSY